MKSAHIRIAASATVVVLACMWGLVSIVKAARAFIHPHGFALTVLPVLAPPIVLAAAAACYLAWQLYQIHKEEQS